MPDEALADEGSPGVLSDLMARGPRYWTAAVTRYCEETRAAHHVERQGFQFLLPEYEESRGGRWRKTLMFPGYILVKLNDDWRKLCSTRGIARLLLGPELNPMRVNKEFVEWLRSREDSRGIVQLTSRPRVGQVGLVMAGAFAGKRGVVEDMDAAGRCRVLLTMMGRAVRKEFDVRDLEAA